MSVDQLIQPWNVKEFGKLQMKETYLLFNNDLDNGHYDVLFSLEAKITGTFDKFFYIQPHQKHFSNSTGYKYTFRVFTYRVTMKILKLKRDEVIAGLRKMHVKELCNLFYSSNIIRVIKL